MNTSRLAAGGIAAVSGFAALSATAAVALGAGSSSRSVVHFPANGPGGQNSHTCFWGVAYSKETSNIIWPETHTDYPASTDTIPAGGKIVLHGRFPHARFFSLTATAPSGQIRGQLYDVNIKADPGSTNPFLPGADRNTTHRSYTVTVVDQPDPGPGHRQPNVLYGGVAGQAPGEGPMVIAERVYLPDRGRDFSGGVGEPAASYVAADGTTPRGQGTCTALSTKPGWRGVVNINPILFPQSKIQQLLSLRKSATGPAVKPAVWYKYFGPSWLLAPYYAGTPDASLISSLPLTQTGLAANPANGYVFTWLDRTFGANRAGHNIAVLHGKLPITPATYAGEPRMQRVTQLRYWSLCSDQGLPSGATVACLADEEIPVNAERDYTIVVSLPQDRPRNATERCGVAWLNWGTKGDGYTRPRQNLLILRNLATTAHPAFRNAVQNIGSPATVKPVTGSYLPTVTYTTAAGFQKQHCKAG